VFAPGFAVTANQYLGAGVEEHHFTLDAGIAQLVEYLRHLIQVADQVAGINPHRNMGGGLPGGVANLAEEGWQQACGQVVDTGKAEIFKNVEGSTFARTGTATDDKEACRSGSCAH